MFAWTEPQENLELERKGKRRVLIISVKKKNNNTLDLLSSQMGHIACFL